MKIHTSVQRIGDKTSRTTVTTIHVTARLGYIGRHDMHSRYVDVSSGEYPTLAEAINDLDRKIRTTVEAYYEPGTWHFGMWEV